MLKKSAVSLLLLPKRWKALAPRLVFSMDANSEKPSLLASKGVRLRTNPNTANPVLMSDDTAVALKFTLLSGAVPPVVLIPIPEIPPLIPNS